MKLKLKYFEYLLYLLVFFVPLFQAIELNRMDAYVIVDMFVNLMLWYVIIKAILWLYKYIEIRINKKNK